jgi:hypothetical protein
MVWPIQFKRKHSKKKKKKSIEEYWGCPDGKKARGR